MRRKPGTLLPIEISILSVGVDLRATGEPQFHGYRAAQAIRDEFGVTVAPVAADFNTREGRQAILAAAGDMGGAAKVAVSTWQRQASVSGCPASGRR